jgi:hypothetical protein
MPIYDLPIWAHDRPDVSTINGAGWRIGTRTVAARTKRGRDAHFREMRKRYPSYSLHQILEDNQIRIAPQLYVEAKTRLAAQRACDLVYACMLILDGSALMDEIDLIAVPHDRDDLEGLTEFDLSRHSHNVIGHDGVILASRMAATVSKRRPLTYACYKLRLSLSIAFAPIVELDPFYNRKQFAVEKHPLAHVRFATAVTLAYSAIEEMQLEARSLNGVAARKPDGSWDPKAFNDLKGRLTKARINVDDPDVWNRRGSRTRVHNSPQAPIGPKSSWARGDVRDQTISIYDALAAARWMRSKLTTHRYDKATSSITMYDVSNVQFLARRLLLETAGIWRPLA